MTRQLHPVPVPYDEDAATFDNQPVLRQLDSVEMAVHTFSHLAVVFALALALILICAHHA